MRRLFRIAAPALAAACIPLASAQAEDMVFMLDNRSSDAIVELYASPTDVDSWEDDILDGGTIEPGAFARVTIRDGREVCDYDLRIVFESGEEMEDTTDLCETGSYTVED